MAERVSEDGGAPLDAERVSVVFKLIRGEISPEQVLRTHGISADVLEEWKQSALRLAERALGSSSAAGPRAPTAVSSETFGVWVCAAPGSILPSLLIQAACPGRFPVRASAEWQASGRPPRGFRKTSHLSLLGGIAEAPGPARMVLQLFTAMLDQADLSTADTALSDWRFPVPAAAIVVIVTTGEGPLTRPTSPGRVLNWVKAQGLPYLVAATHVGNEVRVVERLRADLRLGPEAALVQGPAPARRRLDKVSGSQGGGALRASTAALLGLGGVTFDGEYAARILSSLRAVLESAGS